MIQLLKEIAQNQPGFVELRYHKRSSTKLVVTKGRVDTANSGEMTGVGIRALIDGSWGFAATSDLTKSGIKKAVNKAQINAKSLARLKGKTNLSLARKNLAVGDFPSEAYDKLRNMSIASKLGQVIDLEKSLSQKSKFLQKTSCIYKELLEDKIIVTNDGVAARKQVALPEMVMTATAEKSGEHSSTYSSAGITGNWDDLLLHPSLANALESVPKMSIDLLSAKYPEGGLKECILAPSLVGLLCHEAIGHTVEADFVNAGSVAQGKIGELVASPLVSMSDMGTGEFSCGAGGAIPFDDEGILTSNTKIIDEGRLSSYLHNSETAHQYGVSPTGNARAWSYLDEPLIRMCNTYMHPGSSDLEEMIAGVEDGYLLEGAGSGQADSNGEFMFGSSWAYRIKNGQKRELLREATLSGIAFDVLKTVDAVSQEFSWDLGSGFCGKGQPAKVDAGGPYIRCQINVGGEQG